MTLAGKTALITGGGTGIGAAIATTFAAAGCKVAVCGRRMDKLEQVSATAQGQHRIACHVADVSQLHDVDEVVAWAEKELGRIDILVNSAGVNVAKRMLHELSPEDWNSMMQINATGVFYCMRAALPAMRARQDGLIINISSIAGKRAGMLGGVGYNASKFAATALGISAAQEESRNGIRVTNIYPGEVDTPILEKRPTPVSDEHRSRILRPEDVAQSALMVAELPPRAHVLEMIIKPTTQDYV